MKVVVGQQFVVPTNSKVSLLQQPIKQDSDEELEYADNSSGVVEISSMKTTDMLNGQFTSELSESQRGAVSEVGNGGVGFIWSVSEGGHEEEWRHSVAPIPADKLFESIQPTNDELEISTQDGNVLPLSGELEPDSVMNDSDDDDIVDIRVDSAYFEKEVEATFLRAVHENVKDDHVILEVNSLRLSYNRASEDCAGALFYSMMKLALDTPHSSAILNLQHHVRAFTPSLFIQSDQNLGSLKGELRAILPQVEEMRKRKCDRSNQFIEVLEQIHQIRSEIYRSTAYTPSNTVVDETDLSLKKLEELHRELQALQKEKSDRLTQVLDHLNTLNSLCLVLGVDFQQTVNEVHSSLSKSEGTKNICNDTIEQLAATIQRLQEVKIQRMQQLQDLATSMLELWNLMDTPVAEQQMFQKVTCNIVASEHEITEPNMLSINFINYVEAEVSRLEELKARKMKEIVLKKMSELEEICRKTHMIPEPEDSMEFAIEAIESAVDPSSILEQIELRIAKVKDEAFSRKEILEKVEKWMVACEEECWLEEYCRDENRYNAGRGAHLTLKRAEKARTLVNKLPGTVHHT
ncbi:unnamed protein product [Ilex paraguariensis]|uniref:Uncharacterized protein n=1 Tax=Ilex paraguariensis TaxID=185542 RepID=A0ABC8RDQ8_9AQUA